LPHKTISLTLLGTLKRGGRPWARIIDFQFGQVNCNIIVFATLEATKTKRYRTERYSSFWFWGRYMAAC